MAMSGEGRDGTRIYGLICWSQRGLRARMKSAHGEPKLSARTPVVRGDGDLETAVVSTSRTSSASPRSCGRERGGPLLCGTCGDPSRIGREGHARP
jgi:hypothetical protein